MKSRLIFLIVKISIGITLFICVLVSSFFIEYQIFCTERFSCGETPGDSFRVLSIIDKNLPLTKNNIDVLTYSDVGHTPNEFKSFREGFPNQSFMLPPGKYTFPSGDFNTEENGKIQIKVVSKKRGDNILVLLDVYTDDYFFFTKYEVTDEGINPIRSSMIGLGTGFISILFAFIGFGLIGTIDKKYNLIEKLTQKIMRNNKSL